MAILGPVFAKVGLTEDYSIIFHLLRWISQLVWQRRRSPSMMERRPDVGAHIELMNLMTSVTSVTSAANTGWNAVAVVTIKEVGATEIDMQMSRPV